MKKTSFLCVLVLVSFLTPRYILSQQGFQADLLRSGGSTLLDRSDAVAVDADGNMYLAGYFQGTATFQGFSLTSAGNTDGFIVKYDPQGNVVWARRMGGTGADEIRGITITGNDLYVVGYFNDATNFNTPSSFGSNVLNSAGSTDIFLAKYTTGGGFLWARRAGGTNVDRANGVATDGTNVYLTGNFTGTANFNTPSVFGSNEVTSIGNVDMFVSCFNGSGTLQWVRRGGSTGNDEGNSIAVGLTGVYVAGAFESDAHFNLAGLPGATSLTSAGSKDIFVARYSLSGGIEWTRRAGGTGNDIAFGIANIGDNVFITGQFLETANFNTPSAFGSNELVSAGAIDGFYVRFNANGDYAGGRRFGGTNNDYGKSICRIGTTLYVTGTFSSIANFNQPSAFGSNELVSAGFGDMFLARFTNTGGFNWAVRGGGSSNDIGNSVAALNTEVYVGGQFSGTANFNSPSSWGSNTLSTVGDGDAFLVRYSCIPPPPTGDGNQEFCAANNPTVGNLQATGNNIQWFSTPTGGTALTTNTLLVNGQTYYASQSSNGCTSVERLAVTSTIYTIIPAPTGNNTQNFCNGGGQQFFVSQLSATGQNIQWFTTPSGGTALDPTTQLVSGSTYYASQTIAGCTSSTRLAVTVTITNNPLPPMAASPQTFCSNASLTLNDIVISGLNIQWWNSFTFGTQLPSSTTLANGSTYFASQTVNGCTSMRTTVQVSLITPPPAPTGPSTQTFCASANPIISSLTASGTTIKWYDAPTGGNELVFFHALQNDVTYYASQSTGSCEGTERLAVNVVLTDPAPPSGASPQTFCGNPSPKIQDIVVSGAGIEWFQQETGGTSLPGSYFIGNATYYAQQTIDGCSSTSRLAVQTIINDTPLAEAEYNQTFCSASNPTVGDLVATGQNLLWYAAAIGGAPLNLSTPLVNGTFYFAEQTINGCPSTGRAPVLAEVTSTVPPPTASTPQQFCSGTNPTLADISINGSNILWYSASTGGTQIPSSTALINGTTYYASQTIGGCVSSNRVAVFTQVFENPPMPSGATTQGFCANSNPTVNDLSPSTAQWFDTPSGTTPLLNSVPLLDGQIYYGSNTFMGCESERLAVTVQVGTTPPPTGSTSQTFCAIGGVFNTIQDLTVSGTQITWYDSPSGGSQLMSNHIITNGQTYYATQTVTSCESSVRLAVTVTIQTTSAPTGNGVQFFCASDNPTVANLVASGQSVQWFDASIGGNLLNSSQPLVNGMLYFASQTENGCPSATRLGVEVAITVANTPTGDAIQQFCENANPAVQNLVPNGPGINWYLTASGGTALSLASSLTNGTTYYASQTINGCESPNRLSVQVQFTTESPTPTGASNQSFCAESNPTLASIVVNGMGIEWYNTAIGGSPLLNTTPLVSGNTYYAAQNVGGCPSGSRLAVTVTVNAAPNAPSGQSTQSFCSTSNPTVGNLQAIGSNIQWYNSASGGSALMNSHSLANGTTYYASQSVNGCESTTRFPVTVSFLPVPGAPSGDFTQYFCSNQNATINDLVVTGSSIQWYDGVHSSTILNTSTPLQSGMQYYASQTVGGCESEERLQVLVVISTNPSAPTGNTNQTFCAIDNPTVSALQASGDFISWFTSAVGGTALNSGAVLTNGVTYYAEQALNGCPSSSRLPVTVSITSTEAPTGPANQTYCFSDNVTLNELTISGVQVAWYSTAVGGTPLNSSIFVQNSTSYFASQTINGCESQIRLEVTVTINETPTPTGAATQEFCTTSSPTLNDLVVSGQNIQWFTSAFGGTNLPSNSLLVDGTTYYAAQTINDCVSAERLAVQVNVYDEVPAPAGNQNQSFCASDAPTLGDVAVSGTSVTWYDAATGGNLLPINTVLISGTAYYAMQTIGSCESTERLVVTVTIDAIPTSTVTSQNGTLTATANNVTYQWIDCSNDEPIPGETNQSFTPTVSGNYAVQLTNGSCVTNSECTNLQVVGIGELGIQAFIGIIPNPNTGVFQIQTNQIGQFEIIDALGRLIQSAQILNGNTLVNIENEPKGIYFVVLTLNNMKSTHKIVIN